MWSELWFSFLWRCWRQNNLDWLVSVMTRADIASFSRKNDMALEACELVRATLSPHEWRHIFQWVPRAPPLCTLSPIKSFRANKVFIVAHSERFVLHIVMLTMPVDIEVGLCCNTQITISDTKYFLISSSPPRMWRDEGLAKMRPILISFCARVCSGLIPNTDRSLKCEIY